MFVHWILVGIAIGIGLMLAPLMVRLGLALVPAAFVGGGIVVVFLLLGAYPSLVQLPAALAFAAAAMLLLHEVFWRWRDHSIPKWISMAAVGVLCVEISAHWFEVSAGTGSMIPSDHGGPTPLAFATVGLWAGLVAAFGRSFLNDAKVWMHFDLAMNAFPAALYVAGFISFYVLAAMTVQSL